MILTLQFLGDESPLLFVFAKFATTIMRGENEEGDYMKNVFYGIMDIFTIMFNLFVFGVVIKSADFECWSWESWIMLITLIWVTIRLIRIHWYIFKTDERAKKSVRKVINR